MNLLINDDRIDPQRPLLIFDGDCNLCSGVVDFIIRRDPSARFLFTTNSSPLVSSLGIDSSTLNTVVLVYQNHLYTRSDAILRVCAEMGWPWKSAIVFRLIPKFVRDALYLLVARWRYRVFGKRKSCRVPSENERNRFV